MKYFIFALTFFILIPLPAKATPIDRETANAYFLNCKANPDPRFSEETQTQFCGCTATQMLSGFTKEDMQKIGNPNDPSARTAVNKLMINIYAPCIQFPAQEYHYQTCVENPKTKILGNPETVCKCAANQVAGYLQNNSKNLLRKILRDNPTIQDPMQAIYNDTDFQNFAQSQLMGCLRR
jgi:hypothetical protein